MNRPTATGQTVRNQSRGSSFRCFKCGDPSHRFKNQTTQCSPFEIVYGQNPNGVLDLAPIPNLGKISGKAEDLAEHIKSIHEQSKSPGKSFAIQKHDLTDHGVARTVATMCSLEKRGNIFLLTLTGDGEHRLNPDLIHSVRSILRQVRAEATRGSALVTIGEGKFFSNGFDLAWAQAAGSAGFLDRLHHMVESFKPIVADLISLPMPTVAAVTGHAAAAGFMLALSHDYVLMRKDRGVLYMSEIDIGLTFPDYFMAIMRSKIASRIARRDVVLRAAKVKAEEAVKMEIIDSAHDSAAETVEAALRLGEQLAGRKWDGEVYAEIRKASFPEACEVLGLVGKAVIASRL
ncbi:hypothetical protein HHK36_001718 [Tetracentron sinense]|uniref:Delta(3)-Delta(2)-enoyl-CoA isomerase n=1 Tax=Tetracentron sinense TaxID=13715 RepID=A0A834ZY04_TETSI|nr:hypothetical protein HHK36_001718 [Tetracentron sinense]